MNLKKAGHILKKYSPQIYMICSVACFGTAVVLGYRSGRKIERIVRKGEKEKKSANDIRKECAKEFIAPVGFAIAGTILAVKSERTSSARIASIGATCWTIRKELEEHKAAMEKVLTQEQVQEVKQEIVNHKANSSYTSNAKSTPVNYIYCTGSGNQLWFDERHRNWFRASPDAVNDALNTVNAELRSNDWCSISVLYQCLDLECPTGDEDNGFVFRKGVNAYSEYKNGVNLIDQYTEHPETHELAKVLAFDHNVINQYVYNDFG